MGPISPGDVVRLATGGPPMVVLTVYGPAATRAHSVARTTWFYDGKREDGVFPVAALVVDAETAEAETEIVSVWEIEVSTRSHAATIVGTRDEAIAHRDRWQCAGVAGTATRRWRRDATREEVARWNAGGAFVLPPGESSPSRQSPAAGRPEEDPP